MKLQKFLKIPRKFLEFSKISVAPVHSEHGGMRTTAAGAGRLSRLGLHVRTGHSTGLKYRSRFWLRWGDTGCLTVIRCHGHRLPSLSLSLPLSLLLPRRLGSRYSIHSSSGCFACSAMHRVVCCPSGWARLTHGGRCGLT